MAEIAVTNTTATRVRHIAKPLGVARENGPHLSDLRVFVEACEGLPDHLLVHITPGTLSESGRRDVTITTELIERVEPSDAPQPAEVTR